MSKLKRFSLSQIERALLSLPAWRFSRKALRRTFRFSTFAEAIRFTVEVAAQAERADHHPDIDIRFNQVHLALHTHDVDGISSRDIHLARLVESLEKRADRV